MVNDILDAVTTQIGNRFGDGYHYYMENVEQGFETPCFTADIIQPTQRSKSSVLYDRTMPIVIHYFPASRTEIKRNSCMIAEDLIECLEYLPFKATILRGENISWSIVEDVLQLFVTYRFTTINNGIAVEGMASIEQATVTHVN